MADSLTLLDQALFLGEQELQALAVGDVDTADENATRRGNLITMAWDKREGVALDALQCKLLKLQSLQGLLTEEARKLHASLKSELQKTKKHSARLQGYRQGARIMPSHSQFVSKQG
jgi:hypothetical protein